MRAIEAAGGFADEHPVVVAIQIGRAGRVADTQHIEVAIVVEVGGVIVGTVGGGIEQHDASKRRLRLVDHGEATVGVAGRELPCTAGTANLVQDVITAVAVEVADDHLRQVARRQHRCSGVGTTGEAGSQQALIAAQLRPERGAFNQPAGTLEAPVATQVHGTRIVGRGRHIGTGNGRQLIDEGLALGRFTDIATVQQQITVGLQCRANALQCRPMLGQVVACQPYVAHLHAAIGTVRQQMNGIQPFAAIEVVGHLLQAILGRVEDDHFGVTRQPLQQACDIGHLAVDEHDLVALVTLFTGRRGSLLVIGYRAVLGRRGCRLGGRRSILGNHPHRGIEHDPRLQGHQQWRLRAASNHWLRCPFARETFDEFHAAPPGDAGLPAWQPG